MKYMNRLAVMVWMIIAAQCLYSHVDLIDPSLFEHYLSEQISLDYNPNWDTDQPVEAGDPQTQEEWDNNRYGDNGSCPSGCHDDRD